MSNYTFAIWMLLSAGLLCLFLYAAFLNMRRRHAAEVGLGDVIPLLQPVDLIALSQVIHPRLEPVGYFRWHSTLRKEHLRQAIDCLHRMSQNAAYLQKVGYGRLHSSNELVASQAKELIEAGVHVRFYTLIGLTILGMWRILRICAMPFVSLAQLLEWQQSMVTHIIPAYQSLREKAEDLTRLRDSGFREPLLRAL